MAELRLFDLGQPLAQAEAIKGARQRNRLAELTMPYQVQNAQNQNSLADLRARQGEQQLAAGEQQAGVTNLELLSRAVNGLGGIEGLETDEQATERLRMAGQILGRAGVDMSGFPESTTLEELRGVAGMSGAGNTNVQSTFRTDDGRLGYVTRDGRTVVTDQKVEGKFQARDYGDQPYVFDPRSGTYMRVGGDAGQTAPADANRARYSDAEAAIYQTRGQEEARREVEKEANAPKERAKVEGQFRQIDSVMQNVDRALENVDWATAGAGGALTGWVPGTPARDLRATIDTIKANLGFDRLQQMRDQSPTGGALGQVSEMELRLLNSAVQSLDTDQSPEQLRQNLQKIRYHYDQFRDAISRAYSEQYQEPAREPAGAQAPTTGRMRGRGGNQTVNWDDL